MAPSRTENGPASLVTAKALPNGKLWTETYSKEDKLSKIDIIDIRHDAVEINLREEISKSLDPGAGPKTIPTLVLYDERGLQLFEKVD
jgi:hypothetical protein